MSESTSPRPLRPLRLMPGVVIVGLQWLIAFVLPRIAPDAELFGFPVGALAVLGGAACGLLIVLWWLFFSRARWSERLGAIVAIMAALAVTRLLAHRSIAGAGMGMMLYIATPPYWSLALVAWAWISRRPIAEGGRRWAFLVAAMVLACAPWTLIRTAGVGRGGSEFHFRWTPTPEQRLLARGADEPKPLPAPAPPPSTPEPAVTPPDASAAAPNTAPVTTPPTRPAATPTAAPAAAPASVEPGALATPSPAPAASVAPGHATSVVIRKPAEWPGFRGPNRDGVVHGVRIQTDWSVAPPTQMWRRPIGPGWSSFAVDGDLLYTQEQRGDDEIVACYRVSTGEPVWRHRDAVRFWESNGGAGPRGTPAISGGRVFAFGATGILNALDARTGAVAWSRNVATDTGRRVPDWGFSSSPLIVDDEVVVAASGTLAGYDISTGTPRWRGPSYGGSYSSPQRATIGGVTQIVLLGGPGAIGVAADNGAVLWEHKWSPGAIVQPAVMADGDLLINAIAPVGGLGTRRLAVTHGAEGWRVEERWTSTGLKPYFNDFVVHKGHAYGFDNNILACIGLDDGARKWKGGRYGNGQMILLSDQDLLLIVSEEGELALVGATTDQYKEIAKVPALDGKTWNHPVVVRDVLLVRNGEEMAAFRLPLAPQ